MAMATIVLYWEYLVGLKVFIMPHVISDSINQFYPAYVDAARNFAEQKTANFYSLFSGLGLQRNYTSPFFMFIFMWGEEFVPYMMGMKAALCVFLSGWLMGLFLNEAGYKLSACLFGGLSYAFSMQVVIAGSYMFQGELAVIAALALYALEKCFHKKRMGIFWLSFSVIISYLSLNIYYWLIYGGVALAYILVRVFYVNEGWKRITFRMKVILLCGIALLAVSGMLVLSPKLEGIIRSNRFQVGLEGWKGQWANTFSWDNALAIINFIYRTISANILGIWNIEQEYGYPFRGSGDDSGYYVGVLALLLLPLVFGIKEGKKRRTTQVGVLMLVLLSVLILFPGIRIFINGFSGTNFKLTRLLGSLVLVGIAFYVWNEFIGKGRHINMLPVLAMDFVIALFLILPSLSGQTCLYPTDVLRTAIFLALYTALFLLWNIKESGRKYIKVILLVSAALELILTDYRYINHEDALSKDELMSGYYNDGTMEVMKDIESFDRDCPFYRVNKAYESVLYSDAEVQGYYGTAFYRGGADDKYMSDFLTMFAVPTKSNILGLCTGTYGYPALSAICGVRYGISYNEYSELGYQFIKRIDEKNLYENKEALPTAFLYHDIISDERMSEYSLRERHDILLQACVLNGEVIDTSGISDMGLSDSNFEFNRTMPIREYHYTDYEIGTPLDIETVGEDEVFVIGLKNEIPASVYLYWSTTEGGWSDKDYRILSIYENNLETFIEVANQKEIHGLIFYCLEDVQTLKEVSLYVYPKEEYIKFLEGKIETLKKDASELYDTGESFVGEFVAEESGVLHISIPYNAPYKYYLNDELCETVRANYIFTGILVEKGEYRLKIIKN